MLGRLGRAPGAGAWARAAAAAAPALSSAPPAQLQQERGIALFELFSKERRAERQRALKEDMARGYFDDFRSFRDSGGKMFRATERLIAAGAALPFPPIAPAAAPSGAAAPFPPPAGDAATPAACLVGVAFRAGAEEMLEAWAAPFAARFAAAAPPGAAALAELSLVESAVMALWPFRGMLARTAPPAALARRALPTARLFHFGDAEPAARALGLTNRLTAYVFLLDGTGRVRWRGSGAPAGGELASLLAAGEALLREAGVPVLPAADAAEAPEAEALSERAGERTNECM